MDRQRRPRPLPRQIIRHRACGHQPRRLPVRPLPPRIQARRTRRPCGPRRGNNRHPALLGRRMGRQAGTHPQRLPRLPQHRSRRSPPRGRVQQLRERPRVRALIARHGRPVEGQDQALHRHNRNVGRKQGRRLHRALRVARRARSMGRSQLRQRRLRCNSHRRADAQHPRQRLRTPRPGRHARSFPRARRPRTPPPRIRPHGAHPHRNVGHTAARNRL